MKALFFIMLCVFLISNTGKSQSISSQVYSSAGGFYSDSKRMLSWTSGEVIIDTYFSQINILTQGFHQPSETKKTDETDTVEFFNGFSPNGDGINDYWKIPILYKYPLNRVTIMNRWGSIVWIDENYDNDLVKFIGKNMNNEDLPDGTYFFEIIYGLNLKNGWVFIKR